MKMKKVWVGLSMLIFLASSLMGCGNTDASENNSTKVEDTANVDSDEKIVIRVGDQPVNSSVMFGYGKEVGELEKYLKDYNVEIEVLTFESGPAMNEAFAAGQLDFATMGNMPGITGVANDYGYKILGVTDYTDYSGALVASVDSGINSVADLKGKKVGTFIGGSWHYITSKYLESVGLSLDDVELMNTAAETATSIKSGDLDAGVMGSATAQQLENEGSGKIIAEQCGTPSFSVVCGSEKFISKYPELTEAILKGYNDTQKYSSEHLDEFFEYLGEVTGADTTTTEQTWNQRERETRNFTDDDIAILEDLLHWMQDNSLVANKDITVNDLIELKYIEEAGL